jgi:hypothetical protein
MGTAGVLPNSAVLTGTLYLNIQEWLNVGSKSVYSFRLDPVTARVDGHKQQAISNKPKARSHKQEATGRRNGI